MLRLLVRHDDYVRRRRRRFVLFLLFPVAMLLATAVLTFLALRDRNDLRAEGAKEAFGILGAQAQGALGELRRLATDSKTSRATADRAVAALGYIGEEALPSLLAILKNKQHGSVRGSAAKRI